MTQKITLRIKDELYNTIKEIADEQNTNCSIVLNDVIARGIISMQKQNTDIRIGMLQLIAMYNNAFPDKKIVIKRGDNI